MMDSIKVISHHQYTIQNTIIELLQHYINYLVKFSTAAQHASNHTLNKAKFTCMFYRLSGYVIPITVHTEWYSCVPRYKTHATYCCPSEIQSI